MKKLLFFFCLAITIIAQSQPITGSIGSPSTATQIKGVIVADKGINVPTDQTVFNPTRPWAIRASVADSSLELWTGFSWTKVRGIFTETDPQFDTKFATKNTGQLAEGSNLYWTNARFDTRGDIRYLKLTDIPDSIAKYGFYFESPLGVVAGVGINPSTGLPNRDTVVVIPGSLSNTYLANMAAATFKGSIAGGVPADLTVSQVETLLGISNVENTALSTWAGTTNLNILGTVGTGIWNGTIITGQYGGTGVNNSGKTITLGGNYTTSGSFPLTFTLTGSTTLILPTAGTVSTVSGIETLTNKTLTSPTINSATINTVTINTGILNSPRLNTSSTAGYVWTATDALGNGAWATVASGDVTAAGNNIFTGTNSFTNVSFKLSVPHTNDITKTKILVVDTTDQRAYHQPGSYISETGAAAGLPVVYTSPGLYGIASASAMRSTLGLVIGTNVQAYDADLTTYAGITPSANVQSLLGAANYSSMRTLLGLVIGTNVQAYDADLTTYAGITPSANVQSLLGAADYAAMRTQLGLVIGTNVQAYDADLTTYAGITPSANVQSLLGAADYAAMRTQLGLVIGTDIQAYDADLSALAALTGTNTIYYRSAANTWSAVIIGPNLSFSAGTLDALAGSNGEANTASSQGGGLSLVLTKSGVDLPFVSLNASHFDIATNVVSIDATLVSTWNGKQNAISVGTDQILYNNSGITGSNDLKFDVAIGTGISTVDLSGTNGSGVAMRYGGVLKGYNYVYSDGDYYITAIEDMRLEWAVGGKLISSQLASGVATPTPTGTEHMVTIDANGVWGHRVISSGSGVTSVDGTLNRITSTGGTTPVIDISSSYVGQVSITTLGTIGTGIWQGTSIATTYTDAKIKTVTGTANRLTIGGTATDPTFDISTSYIGQNTITTLGTITTGVWNAGSITTSSDITTSAGSFSLSGIGATNALGLYLRKQTAATSSPLTSQGLVWVNSSDQLMYSIGNPTVDRKLITSTDFGTGLNYNAGSITANISTGIAGGQSIYGGTAASENLTILSTSHATKGNIIFGTSAGMHYDGNALELRIGSASDLGAYKLQVTGDTRMVGALSVSTNILASTTILSGTGIGYPTGSGVGGSVTQLTNKSTGVTLNTATGEIVMNAAALAAATIATFTLTNSSIAAGDILVVNHVTTGTRGGYTINANCAAGSATITVRNNTAGSLSEAIVIRFSVIKSSSN